MKNLKKKVLIITIIIVVVIGAMGFFFLKTDMGNKCAFWITNKLVSHRVAGTEKPQFTMTAEALIKVFTENNQQALIQYNDKSILISGKVTSVEDKNIVLNQSLVCSIDSTQREKIKSIKINDEVNIQGRCIGFNDLMGEVTLDACYIK